MISAHAETHTTTTKQITMKTKMMTLRVTENWKETIALFEVKVKTM